MQNNQNSHTLLVGVYNGFGKVLAVSNKAKHSSTLCQKTKLQQIQLKNLTGFYQWFIYQAVCHQKIQKRHGISVCCAEEAGFIGKIQLNKAEMKQKVDWSFPSQFLCSVETEGTSLCWLRILGQRLFLVMVLLMISTVPDTE